MASEDHSSSREPSHAGGVKPSREAAPSAAGGFYILSLKWTRGEHLTWWRPDNAGYTADLLQAGIYSTEAVLASRDYYDDGEDTLAVPVAAAERFAITRRPVTNARSIRIKLRRARTRAVNLALSLATASPESGTTGVWPNQSPTPLSKTEVQS